MTLQTASEVPAMSSRRRHRLLRLAIMLLIVWVVAAYFLLPIAWRLATRRHPALDDMSRITLTANGIHGDPLDIGLVGSEEKIVQAMLAAKWFPADPITLRSSLRIAAGTVLRRTYDTAPVSNLFLWGHKQDLAFEQPYGKDPRRRHHVRFWRSDKLDENGYPLWAGAATFDTSVGFSHTTGQITHHINADLDAERDKLLADLTCTGLLTTVYWVEGFHDHLQGRNGGGDHWHTDGRFPVGVIAIKDAPTHGEPVGAHVAKDQDKQFRRMVTGTWNFDDYQAKRTMTLKENGIGTMVVDLSGWRAALSAPRLRFDMVWSMEGGHLKKKTVGGEPATQVQIALKTIGDTADERILELTEHRLLLLDGDGKTKYDWRRVQK